MIHSLCVRWEGRRRSIRCGPWDRGFWTREPRIATMPPVAVLERISHLGHEQVIAFQDPRSELRGFLAIHSTRRGPALGGVRLLRYASEEQAFEDALRLSRAMTLKTAL